jgi:hypothetical protein
MRWLLLGLGLMGCGASKAGSLESADPEAPVAADTSPTDPAPPSSTPRAQASTSTTESTPGQLPADVGQWKWHQVDGMECADGSPTGVGINRGPGSEVVMFLAPGGACWDEATCATGIAVHMDGYGQTQFDADVKSDFSRPNNLLNRDAPNNPWKDASFVYVPYCTGDVHAGSATAHFAIANKTMHYSGRKNLDAALAAITPQFSAATHVTLTGSSAGGFGAAINFSRVQKAFGATRVDLVDDSGPPFEQGNIPLFGAWKSAWNLEDAFPPDCVECRDNLAAITPYHAKTFPNSRFAFLSHDHDKVISAFFVTLEPIFAGELGSLESQRFDPLANSKYYVVAGSDHMMLFDLTTTTANQPLWQWLAAMHGDDPTWKSLTP